MSFSLMSLKVRPHILEVSNRADAAGMVCDQARWCFSDKACSMFPFPLWACTSLASLSTRWASGSLLFLPSCPHHVRKALGGLLCGAGRDAAHSLTSWEPAAWGLCHTGEAAWGTLFFPFHNLVRASFLIWAEPWSYKKCKVPETEQ